MRDKPKEQMSKACFMVGIIVVEVINKERISCKEANRP